MFLKQKQPYEQLFVQLTEIESAMERKNVQPEKELENCIMIRGPLYSNTVVTFWQISKGNGNHAQKYKIADG